MGLPHSTIMHDSAAQTATDYTIYTFKNCTHGSEKWQRDETTENMTHAITRAQALFQSGDFCKVEIRKTMTNTKTGQISDRKFKIYRKRGEWSLRMPWAARLCAVAGIVVFAVSVLIGSR